MTATPNQQAFDTLPPGDRYRRRGQRWTLRLSGLALIAAFLWWGLPWLLTPSGIGPAVAPDPAEFDGPVIQVYGADVIGVRGRYAIHTWIATKLEGADEYQIAEVIGWRLRRNRPALRQVAGNPARRWFGAKPILLYERRGPEAAELIDKVHRAIDAYPFARQYTMWPGPNSNSFVAWVGLSVPEMGLELPAKAIGKTWMARNFADVNREATDSLTAHSD